MFGYRSTAANQRSLNWVDYLVLTGARWLKWQQTEAVSPVILSSVNHLFAEIVEVELIDSYQPLDTGRVVDPKYSYDGFGSGSYWPSLTALMVRVIEGSWLSMIGDCWREYTTVIYSFCWPKPLDVLTGYLDN